MKALNPRESWKTRTAGAVGPPVEKRCWASRSNDSTDIMTDFMSYMFTHECMHTHTHIYIYIYIIIYIYIYIYLCIYVDMYFKYACIYIYIYLYIYIYCTHTF